MRRLFFIRFFIELSGAVYIVVNSGEPDPFRRRSHSTGSGRVHHSKFHAIMNRTLTIILLTGAVIIGLYLIKIPETRTWGIIIFLASFALLYTFVVRRRNTPKK